MEFWDIYDKDRKLTGKKIIRGEKMLPTEYHLVVHVWIKNTEGNFLISKRTPNKTYPNMWETTGGSAIAGDDSLTTALKETKEELGLNLNSKLGKIIHTERRDHFDRRDFLDVWLFEQEFDVKDVTLQESETCDARFATAKEILSMIELREFIDIYTFFDKN